MTTTRYRAVLLSLVGALLLAGCGAREYPWYREGMTESQLKQDEKECAAQSQNYGFLNPQLNAPGTTVAGGGPSGRVVVQEEGDLFRTCMNARGYARVPPPKDGETKPGQTK